MALYLLFRVMFIVMVYSRHIGIVKKDEQLKTDIWLTLETHKNYKISHIM